MSELSYDAPNAHWYGREVIAGPVVTSPKLSQLLQENDNGNYLLGNYVHLPPLLVSDAPPDSPSLNVALEVYQPGFHQLRLTETPGVHYVDFDSDGNGFLTIRPVNGRVGINSDPIAAAFYVLDGTNPQLRLSQAAAGANDTNYADFRVGSNGSLHLLPSSQQVSINSTAPPTGGNNFIGTAFEIVHPGGYAQLSLTDTVGGATTDFATDDIGNLYVVPSSGKIALNMTTAPARPLEVFGLGEPQLRLTYLPASGTQYVDFQADTGGNLEVLPAGGKVGINITASPARALEVRDSNGIPLRISRDATHFVDFSVDAGGDLGITPQGNDTTINGNLTVTGTIIGTISPGPIAAHSLLGNNTGSSAPPAGLSVSQVAAMLVGTTAGTLAAGNDSRFTGPAGGDLTGNYPNPTIAALAVGNAKISDVAWTKVTGAPTSFPPSGNATGDLAPSPYSNLVVSGLQGLVLPAGIANGFLKRNGGNSAWEEVAYGTGANTVCQGNDGRFTGPATGDLSANYPSPTVSGIQGQQFSTLNTANGFLKRNSGNTAWEEVAYCPDNVSTPNTPVQGNDTRLSNSRPPSGAATGDLAGSTYANLIIANNAITTAKIGNSQVTLAKIANQNDQTILGNNAGVSGPPIALSVAQIVTMLAGTDGNHLTIGNDSRFTTITPNSVSTNYTLVLTDAGKVIEVNSTSNLTVSVPTNASVAFPVGTVIEIWRQNTGTVTVAAVTPGTTSILSPNALITAAARYSTIALRKQATDTWVLSGDLA